MTDVRIPLDGWEDDAGQQMFIVEAEDDTVRVELPAGHHGVINIWPAEARALAEALQAYAEIASRSGEQPPVPATPREREGTGGTNEGEA